MIETLIPLAGSATALLFAVGGLATLSVLAYAAVQASRAEELHRSYAAARMRLPAATQLEDVEEKLTLRRADLAEVEAALTERRKQLLDADKARLEYEHWRQLCEDAKADHAALEDLRAEVQAVRDQYEAAAATLAERRAELAQIVADRDNAVAEIARLQERIAALKAQAAEAENLEHRIKDLSEKLQALQARVEECEALQREVAALEVKRDMLVPALRQLQSDLQRLEEERAASVRQIESLVDQRNEAQARYEAVRADLAQARSAAEDLDARRSALDAQVARLEERLTDLRSETARLEAGHEAIQGAIAAAADQRDRASDELREVRTRLVQARSEAERLEERRAALDAQAAQLEEKLKELRSKIGEPPDEVRKGGGTAVDTRQVLADLLTRPSCLFDGSAALLDQQTDITDERQALDRVKAYLTGLGLVFDDRVLMRFHTSLKIGRISPLTVLAGISGTGKSQLPQRYAEAMGIHFLKLAVQPRWDSPQDLLGFYNYLEKRYKATDLARALFCMDRTLDRQKFETAGSMSDRVLLVLLDEMNIARVEYYFSEFLSRLEGRPEHDDDDEARRRSSRIEIEVPGKSVGIYPGHNVLFAGTMNQDGSTQSLSDKVLDRGNTLLFRKPDNLAAEAAGQATPATTHLPFTTWASWQRSFSSLPGDRQSTCRNLVDKLNDHCAALRRPFGFRIAQSVFEYVANHPDSATDEGMRRALADMVEIRILPKLRGVELESEARTALQRISEMASSELHDTDLRNRIDAGRNRGDVFDWTAT